MTAFFGARMRSGFEVVAEAVGLRARLAGADLCITGEGQLDAQSLAGKTCVGVARMCRQAGVRCVAIVGGIGDGAEMVLGEGVERYVAIGDGLSVEASIRRAPELLQAVAREIVLGAPHTRGG
jgi:glycerate kinase